MRCPLYHLCGPNRALRRSLGCVGDCLSTGAFRVSEEELGIRKMGTVLQTGGERRGKRGGGEEPAWGREGAGRGRGSVGHGATGVEGRNGQPSVRNGAQKDGDRSQSPCAVGPRPWHPEANQLDPESSTRLPSP